jgi:high mobility group protein B1
MSDQHRGAWGAREDAVWWPGAISADQQNLHHQQIINQHHQQNHMQQQQQQQQQIHQVVVQQQQNNSTTSSSASQQLFSYKMATSFPSTGVSTSNAYDYRLAGMGTQGMNVTTTPGTQWWYTAAGQNALENLQQAQQQQVSQQNQQQQAQQQSQAHQHQQNVHNAHSNANSVSILFRIQMNLFCCVSWCCY